MEPETRIRETAKRRFGVTTLRPFQALVVQDILEAEEAGRRQDLLVVLPTGSGKSLCFMLPSLLVKGVTLVVYPLLSLMRDQKKRFDKAGINSLILQGGQSSSARQFLFDSLSDGTCRVLITNPEMLGQPEILSMLSTIPLSLAVIDEAHTVVQWGRSFRPGYRSLGIELDYLHVRQVLAFTATASPRIVQSLEDMLFMGRTAKLIHGSSNRPNIRYHREFTLSRSRTVATLLAPAKRRPAIVFCPTRDETVLGARRFLYDHPDIPVRYYHAGLTSPQRKELEDWLFKTPGAVLFSTIAFGMGVDKKDIRTIVHWRLFGGVESYLQESGRAGRDGKASDAWVLLPPRELITRKDPLTDIFLGDTCFRSNLAKAMGEEPEPCSGCDICDGRSMPWCDGEKEILLKVLSRPFLLSRHALVLLLKEGVLKDWDDREIEEAVDTLFKTGALKRILGRIVPGKAFPLRKLCKAAFSMPYWWHGYPAIHRTGSTHPLLPRAIRTLPIGERRQ